MLPQVFHGGEIHTVDIDPTNTVVATGGKDHKICLWTLRDILTVDATTADQTELTPLETFEFHDATIRIARWNPKDNKIFASGDYDGKVYITNTQEKSHKLIYPWPLLEDEKSEVIDGTWSSDGRIFAWSTNDGKVHAYDTLKETHQDLTTETKDGKVTIQRSIACDPTNNYFVSMGDDTFVHVYQYHYELNDNYQFKIVAKISKLMTNNPYSTSNINYKRISWSCDGEFFAVPTASKQLAPLISLLSRSQGWENKISLVGHDLDCDVVKFGPRIYEADPLFYEPGVFNVFHVIASAGADKTLVVWNTSKETPLFVLRDVALKPIVDICWDLSGNNLLATSLDGKIIVVNFVENELGRIATGAVLAQLEETQRQHIKPFNIKGEVAAITKKGAKSDSDLVDQKDAVSVVKAFAEKKPVKEEASVKVEEKKAPKIESDSANVAEITPTVIAATNEEKVEADDILLSAMTDRALTIPPKVTRTRAAKAAVKQAAVKQAAPQKVTTKNGKKRIQPVLLSNGNSNGRVSPLAELSSLSIESTAQKSNKTLMEFDKPSYSVSEEAQKESKRVKAQDDKGSSKKPKRDLEPIKFVGSVVLNPNTTFAKVRLSIPKIRMAFRVVSTKEGGNFALDIRNGQGNETAPSRITYFKKEQQIWCDFIPRYIQLAVEGENFWAVCTVDGQILTYHHTSGKRYLPPIVMGSPILFLESHGKYLMAVTAIAEVYVWDMEAKKLHLSCPLSLSSLLDLNNKYQEDTLSKADNITMCSITSKGIPLVTLSNGSGYLYNNDMGTWQTVTEAWWAFGSHYWDSIGDEKMSSEPQMSKLLGQDDQSSILGLLEHRTNEEIIRKSRLGRGKYFNKISKNMIMKEGFENLENIISLSHLENRILCCELLGEFKEFHDHLMTYCKRVCELGFKAKLFEICQLFLGPEDETPLMTGETKETWVSTICGYDKRELLKEIILSCATSRDAQRILVHFSKKLGMIGEEY